MAHAIRNIPLTLNTDGKPHPLENTLTALTAVLGLVAIITSIWSGLHVISCWAGLAGVVAGAWAQMISVTTSERFVTIIGLGAAAVGFGLGMAHGGFL